MVGDQTKPLPVPSIVPMMLSAVVWWCVKATLGIGCLVAIAILLGQSAWLGVAVGSALAFVAAQAHPS